MNCFVLFIIFQSVIIIICSLFSLIFSKRYIKYFVASFLVFSSESAFIVTDNPQQLKTIS